MNRYELIDNFMMTRLPKPSQTSVHPYELIENVSDGIYFFKYSYTIICLCVLFSTKIQYKKEYKKQLKYLNKMYL